MSHARWIVLVALGGACASSAACVAETPPAKASPPPPAPTMASASPSASVAPVPSTSASSLASASSAASASSSASPPVAVAIRPEALVVTPFAPGPQASRGTVSRTKPFTAHGATLTLVRASHKERLDGGVVGIWEWELRKGSAVVTGSLTDEILYAEMAVGGVLAVMSGDGETLDVTMVPWTRAPWTQDEAADFADAEHARRGLPPSNGTGTSVEAGVLDRAYMGDPVVRMRVGMHTRTLLSIKVSPLATGKAKRAP